MLSGSRLLVPSGSRLLVCDHHSVKVVTLIDKCYGDGCHCQIGDISSVHVM